MYLRPDGSIKNSPAEGWLRSTVGLIHNVILKCKEMKQNAISQINLQLGFLGVLSFWRMNYIKNPNVGRWRYTKVYKEKQCFVNSEKTDRWVDKPTISKAEHLAGQVCQTLNDDNTSFVSVWTKIKLPPIRVKTECNSATCHFIDWFWGTCV